MRRVKDTNHYEVKTNEQRLLRECTGINDETITTTNTKKRILPPINQYQCWIMESYHMGIDPKIIKCTNCNCSWKPGTLHKIRMLLFGDYTRYCPQCGTRMRYKLIYHVVKVESKKILDENIWRNS